MVESIQMIVVRVAVSLKTLELHKQCKQGSVHNVTMSEDKSTQLPWKK